MEYDLVFPQLSGHIIPSNLRFMIYKLLKKQWEKIRNNGFQGILACLKCNLHIVIFSPSWQIMESKVPENFRG